VLNYIKVGVIYVTWTFWDNGNALGSSNFYAFGFTDGDAMKNAVDFYSIGGFRNTFDVIWFEYRYLELNKFNLIRYWLQENPNTFYNSLTSLEILTPESPKKVWNSKKSPDGGWISRT
jgi:hypothetical protein